MKMLHLTLHKKWFDLIASGHKTVEYRDIKPYWTSRLRKKPDDILFRNGYGPTRPFLVCKCRGVLMDIHEGKYSLLLGEITKRGYG